MFLPEYHNLPTDKLGCIFKDTTATYKYFWFLSILERNMVAMTHPENISHRNQRYIKIDSYK